MVRIKIFLLFSWPLIIMGQLNDDFSDGNFTQSPSWIGDTEKFIINDDYKLQLFDDQEGVSYLATGNNRVDNTQWEFWVRVAFTPSDHNHAKIYLVSDSKKLNEELNGYFLQIGKTGTGNKHLFFYRQDGSDIYKLMEGKTEIAAGTNNIIRVKVIRDDAGNWEFWADGRGGHLFLPQGAVLDSTHTNTGWFGLLCNYTVTNSSRFYFDDIYTGNIIPDNEPPRVKRISVADPNTLDVIYSKAVEKESAENTGNYFVDQGIGAPLVASLNPNTPNIVRLMFDKNFTINNYYKLTIANIKDLSGNKLMIHEDNFVNFNVQRFDVVFNELMVNISPSVDLPSHEYIELYNTTGFEIDIEGWMLHDRTTIREIPHAIIPSKGYLVLTTEDGYDEMVKYGNVVAVPGFTFFSVTHGGTELVLMDDTGYIVSSVRYSDEWYHDPAKDDGGWSLEKIDPYNFCGGKDNWHASVDKRGGTPGETNSVRDDNPDLVPPGLVRAGVLDKDTIILFFSEPMDEYSLLEKGDYYIYNEDHDIGHPSYIEALTPSFQQVKLALPAKIREGLFYRVIAEPSLADCAGNMLDNNTTRVGLPQLADPFDVVINEILFNPPEKPSQRYIELYNRSEKIIDLKNYKIASKDTIENHLETIRDIYHMSYLFFPGDYVVLTTSPGDVKEHYMTNTPEGFIGLSSMPRMTNAGGIAVFTNKSNEIIDMVIYSEDMQYALLHNKKGVALERLNYHRPSGSKSNWHSASEASGFGTPGYKNSQFTYDPGRAEDDITIYPEIFSPNNDGHDDVLNIQLKFDEPGFTANINVYDPRGRHIKTVARSKLLGTDDIITWDGTTDNNQKANIGIYVIFIELFDPSGNVRKYKKSAVLAGKL